MIYRHRQGLAFVIRQRDGGKIKRMQASNKRDIKISFEVRCSSCGFFELWGLQQAIQALTQAGKLSPATDFDADLFAELFLVHAGKIACPNCRAIETLQANRVKAGDWDWADAVYCEDCGREIPPARLAAVPDTKLCVRCQNKQDHYDEF